MLYSLHQCVLWACAALLLAGLGCRSAQSTSGAPRRVYNDELKRRVAVVPNPPRIVSLAPNLTEMLFALGLGERVVAVTSYCDYPAAALSKEKIGSTLQPNLERLIALKPDLVIVSTASQLEGLAQQLERLNIPLYITNPRTVRDVLASIRHVGEVTGAVAQAEQLAAALDERIQRVEQRVAQQPKPRVFFVLQLAPLITAGRNTFLNDMLALAGGASISGAESADYPQFSREAVIARAPEFIIAPAMHGDGALGDKELQQAFAATPAVRNQRIVRIHPDLTSRPGPRLIDGLEQLADALHPQQEPSVGPKKP